MSDRSSCWPSFYAYSSCLLSYYKPISSLDEHRMCIKTEMNNNNIRIFICFIVLFISMNITNGIINISTITFHNHSSLIKQLLNRTTTIHPWKKSNSIEILKKLIANRQIITKYNRTLLLTSKFHFNIGHSFENVKDKDIKVHITLR